MNPTSIEEMLRNNAEHFASRPAIVGERGVSLSHRELCVRVAAIVRDLRRAGIGPQDRVAIVLPQGPELALAFLATASGATAAPLNPAYTSVEFQFNLQDLSARALLVLRGDQTLARTVAEALKIPVLELAPLEENCSGLVGVTSSGTEAVVDFPQPDDVAMVLHTSGTTSRPKRVPLRNANLCASAGNVAANLHLQPHDISLSTMPLFHIHGLVCMLAALSAGGCCVCTTAFRADQFGSWLEKWKPTWFSTVPTVLQSLLSTSRDTPFLAPSLRFIRSSSASLPPAVKEGLEEAFGVPVIEAYGMTEAAHQMASNPLPPRPRKAGSVGLPAGPQMIILDEAGAELEQGRTGEVAIKGINVTSGYENNPEANAGAYCRGWFRTGDQGYFDEEGYLFLTGRLKELINRGGEKIVPREIDEVMLMHPSVRQAVAFAVAHPSLGEDVAAAVVLQADAVCGEQELRAFLFERLADFKVPSRVMIVDAIPMGPTGKIQRIGMAARLEELLNSAYEPPVSATEKLIAETIAEVLKLDRIGRRDNFFMLGGDSLRGTQVAVRLGRKLGLDLPAPVLFRFPTVDLLASRIDELTAQREVDDLAAALSELSSEDQIRLLAGIDLPLQ